ncbi:hypothetical protein BSLA_01f2701 [Burkholderia stabilis]|nr:hypothetical protein BSLA_01f2701 [Burkholderia stabilis]
MTRHARRGCSSVRVTRAACVERIRHQPAAFECRYACGVNGSPISLEPRLRAFR